MLKCQYNQIIFCNSNTAVGRFVIFLRNLLNEILRVWFWESRMSILHNRMNLSFTICLATSSHAVPGTVSLVAPSAVRWGHPRLERMASLLGWRCSFYSTHTSRAALKQHTIVVSIILRKLDLRPNSAWIKILMRTLRLLTALLFSHFQLGIYAITF